ncbi:unnamed protein product [Didymodactylos carnosus]|uniref:RRM domain-containing protein n=1 Tax=Didymodactylos carnosus TaxID=1234261 RepID=A0A813YVH4_9BILA|nr:unnamed protein product [Didymodactylos carnosus]CAF0890339.1 unnamed protein product [Didymodactylos carnosus]CAF3573744.1 unnamed protein product [Didymodactylos carnosus]CAF3674772.1 unnamed protein product [Didymodactylos carnosus]
MRDRTTQKTIDQRQQKFAIDQLMMLKTNQISQLNDNYSTHRLNSFCGRSTPLINSQLVPSTKLYLGNLTGEITPHHLLEFYSKFGRLLECVKIRDNYGFIRYETLEQAKDALEKTNGYVFNGQTLKVEYAKNGGNHHVKHRTIPISYPTQHARTYSSSSSSSTSSDMSSPVFEHKYDRKRRLSSDNNIQQQQQQTREHNTIFPTNARTGQQNEHYSLQQPSIQRLNNYLYTYSKQPQQMSKFNSVSSQNRVQTPTFHNNKHHSPVFQSLSQTHEPELLPPGFNYFSISTTTKSGLSQGQTPLNPGMSQHIAMSRTPSSLSTLSTDSHETQQHRTLNNPNFIANGYSNVQESNIHNSSSEHPNLVEQEQQIGWKPATEQLKRDSNPFSTDDDDSAIVVGSKNQQSNGETIRNYDQILDISQNIALKLPSNTSEISKTKVLQQQQSWTDTPLFLSQHSISSSSFVWDYVMFPEAALHPGLCGGGDDMNWWQKRLWPKLEQVFA